MFVEEKKKSICSWSEARVSEATHAPWETRTVY